MYLCAILWWGGGGSAQHLPLTVQFLGWGDRNRLSARDEDEGGLFLRGKGVSLRLHLVRKKNVSGGSGSEQIFRPTALRREGGSNETLSAQKQR